MVISQLGWEEIDLIRVLKHLAVIFYMIVFSNTVEARIKEPVFIRTLKLNFHLLSPLLRT